MSKTARSVPLPRVPKLTHHKPSDRARVRLRGRDIYLGKWGTPEAVEAYRRFLAELMTNGDPAVCRPKPEALTVNELIARYLRHADGYYRGADGELTGELDSIKLSLRPVRELYGRTPAAEFGPLKLDAVRDAMIRSGLSRKNINLRISRVKRMFRWGVARELIPPEVHVKLAALAGLKQGRTEAYERPPVTPAPAEDVNAVLPRLPRPIAAMVKLQILTAMRPGEVVRLRPEEVNRDGAVWEYRPTRHKGQHRGRDRVVMIGPRAQAVLEPFLDDRPAGAYCFSPREAVADLHARRGEARTIPVGYGNAPGTNRKKRPGRKPGACYTTDSYSRAIRRACEAAGVPGWSPHRLRHAAATNVRREFGVEAAQVFLGHADANVTQVYAERDLEKARGVAAAMG